MEQVYIIWPERRIVPGKTIRLWFSDAIANGDIEPDEVDGSDSLEYCAKALSYAGLITLGRNDW